MAKRQGQRKISYIAKANGSRYYGCIRFAICGFSGPESLYSDQSCFNDANSHTRRVLREIVIRMAGCGTVSSLALVRSKNSILVCRTDYLGDIALLARSSPFSTQCVRARFGVVLQTSLKKWFSTRTSLALGRGIHFIQRVLKAHAVVTTAIRGLDYRPEVIQLSSPSRDDSADSRKLSEIATRSLVTSSVTPIGIIKYRLPLPSLMTLI